MKSLSTLRVFIVLLTVALIAPATVVFAQPAVPATYQDVYTSLNNQISAFQSTIPAGGSYPVNFAAELVSANSNRGPLLFSTPYSAVLMELDALKALGIQAVKVGIHFPILYPGFYQNPADYQQYLTFYTQLANDIRGRGLKLVVETGLVVNEPGISDMDCSAFYNSLTLDQYEQGRAAVAVTVAQQIQPDYLSVLNEPDTESIQTGMTALGTPDGSLGMLNVILTALQQAGVSGIPIGAGIGTWLPSYQTFLQNYLGTSIQFIDMHIFPVNFGFLTNAANIAAAAQTAGKSVSVSQAWLQKARDAELGVFTFPQLEARDPFSFWGPLDASFLQAMAQFSRANQLLFFSPFFSALFHANTDYDATNTMTVDQIMATEYQMFSQSITTGQYTPTGQAYSAALLGAPDVTAPSVPSGLATSANTSSIHVSWNVSTDDVGVAGYSVYRNGVPVGTTMSPNYYDLNLPGSTGFTYQISAYDVAGNTSAQSAPIVGTTLTPVDNAPPSDPTGLAVQTVSSSQVGLSWIASSDNNGILGYQIYRGNSATSLTLIAGSPTNSFLDTRVAPSSTYYYAVLAYNILGHVSKISPVVSATTLQEDPPLVPAGLAVVSTTYSQVNLTWSPSSSRVPIAGYLIYRGAAANAMTLIANSKTTTYSDTVVTPSTTFYYAVQAYDNFGVRSDMTDAVSAVTGLEPPPSIPAGVSAAAVSYAQVNLAWSPSTGPIPVAGYLVYRSFNGTSFNLIAGTKTASYADTTVIPNTTIYYAIVAYDNFGVRSAGSSVVNATTQIEPPPSTPTGLSTQIISSTQAVLSWSPSTGPLGVSGYLIYKGVSPSKLNLAAGVGAGVTSYTDTAMNPGYTFYYAVVAYDKYNVRSPQSTVFSVSTAGH